MAASFPLLINRTMGQSVKKLDNFIQKSRFVLKKCVFVDDLFQFRDCCKTHMTQLLIGLRPKN